MQKVLVSILTFTLVLASASPVLAETGVSNVGNGVESTNNTTVNKNNSSSVSQTNTATLNNSISVTSNTGNNTANRNTGGSVTVESGKSHTSVQIENMANSNKASVLNCCNVSGETTVTNQGNGDSADNNAVLNSNQSSSLNQANSAEVFNSVFVNSNTGHNDASRNTGNGDSWFGVSSGESKALVGVSNTANENMAHVGASNVAGQSELLLGNAGNGVESNNNAVANLNNSSTVAQSNAASVLNWVGVNSDTGSNTGARNTGGWVSVESSDSLVGIGLETQVNSNFAAVANNCGCIGLGDSVVKNLGNGDSADSAAVYNNNNTSAAMQANSSDIANTGYFDSLTGLNDASRNTGSVYGWNDPSVVSGGSLTQLATSTNANQNVLNSGLVSLPSHPSMNGNMHNNGYWWSYGWNMQGAMSN